MTDTEADTDTGQRTTTSIRVFGVTGVDGPEGPVSIGGPRQRRLLSLLAIRHDTVVDVDWLAEYLWTDDDRPQATVPALRTYVSRLRQAFPPEAQDWIETAPSGYRLVAPADHVEHRRFALLRAEATRSRERGDPQAAKDLLDEALALWRGEPFRELEDLDWARPVVVQLGLDRLEMLEERWETELDLGRHTQITGELAVFTAEHGMRDRAARQYATALYRCGRTAEALRVIDDHRRTLTDTSGLDPSPAIIELERAILTGDESLTVEPAGRPLRGYRLLEEIGSGAFAVVWRGVQPSVNREVAIKQIRADLASQPEFIRRFEAEAHLVARIEHPYVVPLIDFWRDPDSAYLVMRWLRGGTLERRLDDGPLSLERTLALAHQVGGALSAAHAHGIVHRDVKTANILFDEQGNAFLGDFGIALEVTRSGGPEAALSQGSPAYASPEQIRRERLGPESDIFSLGVVMFECLTGNLPFPDVTSARELVERQLHTPYPSLAELRSDVPAAVSDAVTKATAKDPADRYATVHEFVAALTTPGPASELSADVEPPFLAAITNPYQGLRAFDAGDADRFFGRESLVAEMVARLAGDTILSRAVVVVGPSGSGKSSVVGAGLVPAIKSGAVPGSENWFTTTMTPGTDPFESLEAALLRVAVNPPPSLLDQLRSGERGILRSTRRCLAADGDRVLLVVDQFEELFTGASATDADAFLDALCVAIDDPTSPLRLVATLRADYYDRPLQHPRFARLLKETAIDVTPLAGDELERAIVEPTRRVGVGFEPGLVARIAADTAGQRSPLPLLQYTLGELFEGRDGDELTIDRYETLGGLSGALPAHAESLFDEADAEQRTAIRLVFGRLTNPSEETIDLRRRVPLADLRDDPAIAWVLERFGGARLITFDHEPSTREPTVEVAHEALLREWPRLVGWLDDDRKLLQSVDAAAAAANRWDAGGREESDLLRGARVAAAVELADTQPDRLRPLDLEFVDASRRAADTERDQERRRIRRLRRLVFAVAAALVIALVAGAVAVREQRRADDHAALATRAAEAAEAQAAQAEVATLISRSAATTADDPELSVLLALEAHRRAPGPDSEQAVLNALGAGAFTTRLASRDPIRDPAEPCPDVILNSTGTTDFAVSDGSLVSRDVLSGRTVDHGPAPAPCVGWLADGQLDRRWAGAPDGTTIWLGPHDGDWDVERTFDEPTWLMYPGFTPSGRLVFASFPDGPAQVVLIDDRSGEVVGDPVTGGRDLVGAEVSPDGALVALGFGDPDAADPHGVLVVVDAVTGTERFRFDTPVPASVFTFDLERAELIAGMVDGGEIVTVDLDDGEVVATTSYRAASHLLDLGSLADGMLLAISNGQIETIDRRNGPVGDPVALRDVLAAMVRADGTVVTLMADGGTDVIKVDGNALVGRQWEIDPFAEVVIHDGTVATVAWPQGDPEVVDLATGVRSTQRLVRPDGERVEAVAVRADADGLWALDRDGRLTRWEAERITDRLDLDGWAVAQSSGGRHWAVLLDTGDGLEVEIVELETGDLRVSGSVVVVDRSTIAMSGEGTLHVIDPAGTLRSYDATGSLIHETSTGVANTEVLGADNRSGKVAIASMDDLVVVDPSNGDSVRLDDGDGVVHLGLARDGSLLSTTHLDGTVRLWDLERGEPAGLVWEGTGAIQGSDAWYDADTDTIWVTTSGRVIQIPLDPARWVERACETVGRDLTQTEWDRLVPGDGSLRSACV